MRNSKAKELRKVLKNVFNIDSTETVYETTPKSERIKPVFDVMGKIIGTYQTSTQRLTSSCGRAKYKRFKSYQ